MRVMILPALLLLSACSVLPKAPGPGPALEGPAATGPYAGVRPHGRPGEGAEPAATVEATGTAQPAADRGALGRTVASLGNAAEPGLWLKTPLVTTEGPGQVVYAGRKVTARLIPIEGPKTAGSRASLGLMQALGAPLTGLPEFTVSR